MNLNWDDPLAVPAKPEPAVEAPVAQTMTAPEPQLRTVVSEPAPQEATAPMINDTLARSPQPVVEKPVKAKQPAPVKPAEPEFNPTTAKPVNPEDKPPGCIQYSRPGRRSPGAGPCPAIHQNRPSRDCRAGPVRVRSAASMRGGSPCSTTAGTWG